MSSNSKIGQLIGAEFVGTILVMLGGPGLLILGGDLSPLAIAFGFGVSMALAVGVIGAVANPMFSLALWMARAIPRRELFTDLAGQFLGGIAGAFMIFSLNGLHRYADGTNGWSTRSAAAPGVDLGIASGPFAELGVVFAAELLVATLLVVIVLAAIRSDAPTGTAAGFIGAAYGLASLFLLQISGAGVNPARSLGAAIFAHTDPSALAQVWLFILVPIVAALAGVFVWLGLDEATIDDTVFDNTLLETATDRVLGEPDAQPAPMPPPKPGGS